MMEKIKPHVRIAGQDRKALGDALRRRYEDGASIRALAKETGRSYGFVHRMLSESGAVFRGRGGGNWVRSNGVDSGVQ
jgi:predicted transcriptional regulator